MLLHSVAEDYQLPVMWLNRATDAVPHRHFGDTFKWLFYGDDDTVFFLDNARRLVQGLDPDMPYALTGKTLIRVCATLRTTHDHACQRPCSSYSLILMCPVGDGTLERRCIPAI